MGFNLLVIFSLIAHQDAIKRVIKKIRLKTSSIVQGNKKQREIVNSKRNLYTNKMLILISRLIKHQCLLWKMTIVRKCQVATGPKSLATIVVKRS